MELGEKIKDLRLKKKMTLEELGEKCGVSLQTVFKYEKGIITNLPLERVGLIAEALECSPAYLMGWTDDPNKKAATDNSDGAPDRTSLLVKMFDQLSPEGQEAVLQALVDQLKAGK